MKCLKNQKGQSTVEFIFSFSIAFFMIIYTIKVAINYTTGYLAHYATYMTSRVYLTYETQGNEGAVEAGAILKTAFDDLKVNLYNNALETTNNNPRVSVSGAGDAQLAIIRGIVYDWETSFSVSGLFGGNQTLEMRSESFLGREPARAICLSRTCRAALSAGGFSGQQCKPAAFTLSDNGC